MRSRSRRTGAALAAIVTLVVGTSAAQGAQPIVARARDRFEGWPKDTRAPIAGSPVVADLDGDGLLEVVAGNNSGMVYVWRHDGRLQPGWPRRLPSHDAVIGSPAVGDIDGDGEPEVVATTRYYGEIHAWSARGRRLRGFPIQLSHGNTDFMQGAAALAELDGDAALEIVAATSQGYLHAINGEDATEVAGWPVQLPTANLQTTPLVGDIDGDGGAEIVAQTIDRLYAFNANGTPAAGWPVSLVAAHTSPVAGDLTGDGTIEIVAAGQLDVAAFRPDGGRVFVRTLLSTFFYYSAIGLGDLDGDGTLEIAASESNHGLLHVLDSDGSPRIGWPASTPGFTVMAQTGAPVIADLDGDGLKEVVYGATGGTIHIWRQDGTPFMPPVALSAGVHSTPVVADLDGDGAAEIIVATLDGRVHRLDLPGAWDPDSDDWPMYQGGVRHTGHSGGE